MEIPAAYTNDPDFDLAVEAYVWGFPRMLYARYHHDLLQQPQPFNRFRTMDRLAPPDHGGVNVDTLYGVAWLDLSAGPLVISIPDAADRYYSIQMIDVYANNFAYIGRRTTGTRAQRVVIAGPDTEAPQPPPATTLIHAPSRNVFCFLRTLVDNAADLTTVNAFHRGITVAPLSAAPEQALATLPLEDLAPYFPHSHNPIHELGAAFYDRLGDALAADPPTRPHDIAIMQRLAAIGIAPARHPTQPTPTAIPPLASILLLNAAVAHAHALIFAATANTAVAGWSSLQLDDTNPDPLLKATINRYGIGVLSREEAFYLQPAALALPPFAPVPPWAPTGPDGEPLTGRQAYRLRFEPNALPPVDAFWSLTMYHADLRLVRNLIARYAIGDRTPGLAYNPDGSLEIAIQHEPPAAGPANWLPAPEEGFQLIFRAYQPRPAFVAGDYRLPALTIVPPA